MATTLLRGMWPTLFALLLVVGCAPTGEAPPSPSAARSDCYATFDAGSSGTRLLVYERQSSEWVTHTGPKVEALADPVRSIRGKSPKDIDATTTSVVGALDSIGHDGPLNDKGVPAWQAFDWKTKCDLEGAMVYATAGMRMAEQQDPEQSRVLWQTLNRKLKAALGDGVPVATRTITGFEEGLYAWLAVREQQHRDNFGIVEMGGASAQVTFPCPRCDQADGAGEGAVNTVQVAEKPLQFFSQSFLGLGQDEAPIALGQPASCAYGVGRERPGWREEDCASQIALTGPEGIRDPYDFKAGQRGGYVAVPVGKSGVSDWFLTGAFSYHDHISIDKCCVQGGACNDAPTSCFKPIYTDSLLERIGVPRNAELLDASWTFGAVLCTSTDCLRPLTTPLTCDWLATGCL